ncbi:DUF6266 family protein [Pedobacter hartonius]|uniref:Uncharacterized protein n=1 Tax=Pedobacter hartonius TaxID=425514 RepID=A0A1H4DPU9_9SPHI|nr:DUF6266 family protein [Pedobacter hartonius]SEA74801.1 hypothetical protein SAMN05443550_10552 [Pedobacter hartonius]
MAIQKNGPLGPFSGKLGKVIGYVDKRGQQRLRTVGSYNFDNPSNALKETWLKTSITAVFLKPVLEFIRMGFAVQANAMRTSAYHLAVSLTRKAVTGKFPDLQIDFSKILFSAGDMPVVEHAEVINIEEGLMFTWDTTANREHGTRPSDLVMLMAYIPEIKKAIFLRSGPSRSQGYAYLTLPHIVQKLTLETYISFISEDHKSISNSLYTGQVNWGGPQ